MFSDLSFGDRKWAIILEIVHHWCHILLCSHNTMRAMIPNILYILRVCLYAMFWQLYMQHCFRSSLIINHDHLKNLFSKSKISYWPNFSPSICQNWFEPYVYSFLPWKTKTVIKVSITYEIIALVLFQLWTIFLHRFLKWKSNCNFSTELSWFCGKFCKEKFGDSFTLLSFWWQFKVQMKSNISGFSSDWLNIRAMLFPLTHCAFSV